MSTPSPLRRLAALLLLPLAACCCPELRTDFSTPEATLRTWQANLCHDVPEGEYSCLSGTLQADMYGFPTYYAARQELLEQEPVVAFLVKRVDLPGRAVERLTSDDGTATRLVFEQDGQRFAIDFVLETAVRLVFLDGSEKPARLDGPLWYHVNSLSGRQWIDLRRPRLTDEEREQLASVQLSQQWKIDAIQGLMTAARPPPPSP